MADIVIIGGGICGLGTAVMLAEDGHRVRVVERDPAPIPADLDTAAGWDRRSVAQFGIAHWLQARGTTIMRERIPRAYQLLEENGGLHFNIAKLLLGRNPAAEIEAGDDRFEQLTGRRCTMEWAMATAAEEHPGVTVQRGRVVTGLLTGESAMAGVPHVRGVRLDSGEELLADLVVDASGRRSQVVERLAEIGAQAPLEDATDQGFVYTGRYFRSADGSLPPIKGPILAPYGSFSLLTLPADNGTWSVTLYTLSSDRALRSVREPDVWERVIRACPLHAHWIDHEPITDLYRMAGGVDRHREFVVDGTPCVTGLEVLADAASCTNPSLGRGISFGLMHAEILQRCIAEHLDDPVALALAFHAASEREVRPYHDATVAFDRARVEEMRAAVEERPYEAPPAAQMSNLLAAAGGVDGEAARAYASIFSCNALASEVFSRPGFVEHLQALAPSLSVAPLPGPDRAQVLELVG